MEFVFTEDQITPHPIRVRTFSIIPTEEEREAIINKFMEDHHIEIIPRVKYNPATIELELPL